MGLSLSSLFPAWKEIVTPKFFCLLSTSTIGTVFRRSITFEGENAEMVLKTISFEREETECLKKSDGSESKRLERSVSFKNWESEEANLETSESLDSLGIGKENVSSTCLNCKCKPHVPIQITTKPTILLPEWAMLFSPRPASELDAAATKVQKFYKSYRTRRNLADCAVVVEELWWKALDFAALKRSSETFFDDEKPESALSRWTRARTRAAKVGKGLSKDENAQKLALQHWLEAIDPRHRYGHNLHFYYDMWSDSKSTQPFFYWLDVGDGKEVYIESCPRIDLQRQCIKYLGPNEREAYEVIVENGKLVYKQKGILVNTIEDSKWIFVLSTSRALYVGQKKKGMFQHSSFLSGAATTAAGRLVANNGVLEAIWPYSGHYLPTEENFKEFICFLEENHVDLTNVKRCAVDDDMASSIVPSKESKQPDILDGLSTTALLNRNDAHGNESNNKASNAADVEAQVMVFNLGKPLSCKWNSGVGPRIGCVRDYPPELQTQAFEQVNLSPKLTPSSIAGRRVPIPSPRPSPKVRLSPRLAYMGLPSSRAITNL